MRKQKRAREETAAADVAAMQRAVAKALADKQAEAQAAAAPPADRDAETDIHLFRFDLAYRLRARICAKPRRCANHRCRRLGRCRERLKTVRLRAALLARTAGDRAIAGERMAEKATKTQRNH
ncbi:MAG TPA: hypothetical protein VJ233_16770 [Hyphomicrobiaceae bacterium]|nr:hypothetical protein [Hyphomicrobiaceae bacterium]